jgi:hypothetical protein
VVCTIAVVAVAAAATARLYDYLLRILRPAHRRRRR